MTRRRLLLAQELEEGEATTPPSPPDEPDDPVSVGYPTSGTLLAASTLRNTAIPVSGSGSPGIADVFSPGNSASPGTGRLVAGQTYFRDGETRVVQESVSSDADGWYFPYERGITKVLTVGWNDQEYDELWVKVTLTFEADWEFGKTTKIGGSGFYNRGYTQMPLGDPRKMSGRLVAWKRGDGSIDFGGYIYHRDQPDAYGQTFVTSDQPTITLGETIQVVQQFKCNTPGAYDGEVHYWMKPASAPDYHHVCNATGLRWRLAGDTYGLHVSQWTFMYGGPTDWAPDADIHHITLADFEVRRPV